MPTKEATVYGYLRRFRYGAHRDELERLTGFRRRQVEQAVRRLERRGFVAHGAVVGWWQAIYPIRELPEHDHAINGFKATLAKATRAAA